MHRLNLTIDEALYERARAVSFIEKKSSSQIFRESLRDYLKKNSSRNEQAALLLEADDKDEVLNILKNDTFVSHEDFKRQFDL
jgi:metal-responsive CopG/Arc/MetJ family transcriptional regulator